LVEKKEEEENEEKKKGREEGESGRRLVRMCTGTCFLFFFLAYVMLEAVIAVLHELL
jgi:hypothetical protein